MKHAVFAGCLAVMMLLSLSLFLLRPTAGKERVQPPATMLQKPKTPLPLPVAETPPASFDESHTIIVSTDAGHETLTLETYLAGVVLAEMPASFESAALEAQAVASRTFALRQSKNTKHEGADVCGSGTCCQQYDAAEAVREKLGESYALYDEKVRKAVATTDGLVLLYDDALIDATYFSCSGGRTEAAAAVWGGEVPYLQPVDSPGEESSNRYEGSVSVESAAFKRAILSVDATAVLNGGPAGWFGAVTRTKGGGVASITIGGVTLKGTQVRSLFQLRSTNFTVSVEGENILFQTLGNGHRVGMSQYGAQAMAEAGSDFKEILTHYYSGVSVAPMP